MNRLPFIVLYGLATVVGINAHWRLRTATLSFPSSSGISPGMPQACLSFSIGMSRGWGGSLLFTQKLYSVLSHWGGPLIGRQIMSSCIGWRGERVVIVGLETATPLQAYTEPRLSIISLSWDLPLFILSEMCPFSVVPWDTFLDQVPVKKKRLCSLLRERHPFYLSSFVIAVPFFFHLISFCVDILVPAFCLGPLVAWSSSVHGREV